MNGKTCSSHSVMSKNGVIYKITNSINNKVYIGQTINELQGRWASHKNSHKREDKWGTLIYVAMRKHGVDNFSIQPVEEDIPIDILSSREVFWVKEYDSYTNGYNMTHGGETATSLEKSVIAYDLNGNKALEFGSIKTAAESFDIYPSSISKACSSTGRTSQGYIGKYKSDPIQHTDIEEVLRISNKKRQIDKYDINGIYVCSYDSLSDAAKRCNTLSSSIYSACSGIIAKSKGYVWRYKGDAFNKYGLGNKRDKVVYQYDINGEFISKFPTATSASKTLGICRSSICKACRNKTVYKGYTWIYVNP